MVNEIPFQQHGNMVNFLLQTEIQAVLLTALLGVIGWGFVEWRKSRQRAKKLENSNTGNPPLAVQPQVFVNIGNASKAISPLHQLPSPPANFTGRDKELAELEREIVAAHKVGATISGKHAGLQGMGGVGKTALATVLAHNLKDHYPDAQLYLNLRGADPEHRPPVKSAEAMQIVIHAFQPEAKLPEELDKLTPVYNSVLHDAGRVMLFLDNAADADQIRPLLPPANGLLLVTSRTHFSLPGLAARNIDCLLPENSQELLLKLAPRIKGHEKEAAELCGHLPLALEVFAGVVENNKVFSVPDLLERLRKQPAKLTKADAAFQVSYDLLADDLRRRWTLLAVFPTSFDLSAAVTVWEEKEDSARDAMQALGNTSLVEWNETNGRFRLHDLVRQFCDGKLSETERTDAKLRYAGHYRNVASAADELYLMGSENVLRGLELFDRERTHIEAAFEWLQSKKDKESAILLNSLVSAVAYTCYLRFHPRQRIRWLEVQLAATRIVKDRLAESNALGNLGSAYRHLAEPRKAVEFYEQQLVIVHEIGYRHGEGQALNNLGSAYFDLGETSKAIEFYKQSLMIKREIGDPRGEGNTLGNLGSAYLKSGELRKAVEYYEQQLVIVRKIGDRGGEGSVLGNLGTIYLDLGDKRKAIEFCEGHRDIARKHGDRRGEGVALGNLGNIYGKSGDPRKALELYEQRLVIAGEVGDRRGEGTALWNTAVAHNFLGNRAEAISRGEAALKIYEAIEHPNAAKVRAQLAQWRGDKP